MKIDGRMQVNLPFLLNNLFSIIVPPPAALDPTWENLKVRVRATNGLGYNCKQDKEEGLSSLSPLVQSFLFKLQLHFIKFKKSVKLIVELHKNILCVSILITVNVQQMSDQGF